MGESTRGVFTSSRKGGSGGISPEKIFKIKMCVEAILMHFETIFACETRLIVHTVHKAVYSQFVYSPFRLLLFRVLLLNFTK